MFRRLLLTCSVLSIVLLVVTILHPASVQAGDGIPDNCEYADGAYYHRNIFPRYEPQNQRLVLADWTTGQDQTVLADGLADTRIISWSLDCRYLAAAVGPLTSMDTVVWDTTTATRVGSVPDAHLQPHHLTWGPGDELVVETRDGAVLWNVPANTQITLNTGFNTTTSRDFSRLRWDTAHNQLIANLAVGGRVVYDLATGAEVPLAANTDNAVPDPSGNTIHTILIAGKNYQCQDGYNYGYRHWFNVDGTTVPNVTLDYSLADHEIVLMLTDQASPYEALEVLDTNVALTTFHFRGWSPNCRYVVASLGEPGHKATDTVVWDVLEKRRVGAFLDARDIEHPIQWSPDGTQLVVETRDGAYLWTLATDSRALLTSSVATSLDGASGINSFEGDLVWTKDALFGVTVGSTNAVTAYDRSSGQPVGTYASGSPNGTADFVLSADNAYIAVFNTKAGIGSAWNRAQNTAVAFSFTPSLDSYSKPNILISPDNHYLVINGRKLFVWDLQNPHADNMPTFTYSDGFYYNMTFSSNDTLQADGATFNIVTGAHSNPNANISDTAYAPTPLPTAPLDGVSGMTQADYFGWGDYYRKDTCKGVTANYDPQTRQLTLKSKDNLRVVETTMHPISSFGWSPDCRYFYGDEAFTTVRLPYDANPLDDASYDRFSYNIVIWDAQSGLRLHEFPRPYRYDTGSTVLWSPGGDRVIVRTTNGYFLYYPAGDQAVLLVYPQIPGVYSGQIGDGFSVYWDYPRGQFYVTGTSGVLAFDISTGAGRYIFTSGGCGCAFSLSADKRLLFVNGFSSVGVWNLDTLEHWQVSTPLGGAHIGNRVALSPDNHYLVIVYDSIRVWDLQNLPEQLEDRTPVFTYAGPGNALRAVRFLDNTTIETTDNAGIVQRWGILTGKQVSS